MFCWIIVFFFFFLGTKKKVMNCGCQWQLKGKSYSGSSLVGCGMTSLVCKCGLTAPLKTSWTEENPIKAFLGLRPDTIHRQ
jgi:hypothetical protein